MSNTAEQEPKPTPQSREPESDWDLMQEELRQTGGPRIADQHVGSAATLGFVTPPERVGSASPAEHKAADDTRDMLRNPGDHLG